MNIQQIFLVNFGYFESEFLESLAHDVQREFHLTTLIREGHLDLSEYYDATRRQYNANPLLKDVNLHYGSPYSKILGLFNVDLFIPILTYIFGQAMLNGGSGIASAHRFRNERYGMKTDDRSLFERFSKEVIHELGHTFGLIHCHFPGCVMRSSTYVEDIDQKSGSLCSTCRKAISTGTP